MGEARERARKALVRMAWASAPAEDQETFAPPSLPEAVEQARVIVHDLAARGRHRDANTIAVLCNVVGAADIPAMAALEQARGTIADREKTIASQAEELASLKADRLFLVTKRRELEEAFPGVVITADDRQKLSLARNTLRNKNLSAWHEAASEELVALLTRILDGSPSNAEVLREAGAS
jgi:hypothetical protein